MHKAPLERAPTSNPLIRRLATFLDIGRRERWRAPGVRRGTTPPNGRPPSARCSPAASSARSISAFALSWFGDYLAKAAVTALVYQQTESVALSAATFALSFLPWLVGGPLLAALAERYRYRTVMVVCDLVRMVLIALVAMPGMPVAGDAGAALPDLAGQPAGAGREVRADAADPHRRPARRRAWRSTPAPARRPRSSATSPARRMAPFDPRLALLIDAVTFALSALLIRFGVKDRPPATTAGAAAPPDARDRRGVRHGLRHAGAARASPSWSSRPCSSRSCPEGLAAAWAADVAESDAERGLQPGPDHGGQPVGFILGGLLIAPAGPPGAPAAADPARSRSSPRWRSCPPCSTPPRVGVAAMAAVCGFAVAGMMPDGERAVRPGAAARLPGPRLRRDAERRPDHAGPRGPRHRPARRRVPAAHRWSACGASRGVLLMVVATARWPSPQRLRRRYRRGEPRPAHRDADGGHHGRPARTARPRCAPDAEAAQAQAAPRTRRAAATTGPGRPDAARRRYGRPRRPPTPTPRCDQPYAAGQRRTGWQDGSGDRRASGRTNLLRRVRRRADLPQARRRVLRRCRHRSAAAAAVPGGRPRPGRRAADACS